MGKNKKEYKLRYNRLFIEEDLKSLFEKIKKDIYSCENIDNYGYEIFFYNDENYTIKTEKYESLNSYKTTLLYIDSLIKNIKIFKDQINNSLEDLKSFFNKNNSNEITEKNNDHEDSK